jgi:RNA 2',3'-cyclic 3'-phosphodiesterase
MAEAQSAASAPVARIFFALWPDPAVRQALTEIGARMHRQLEGRLTRQESVHMTLLFLGDTAVDRLPALAQAAASVPFEAFTLHIDTADCWKHNKVAWVAPSSVPPELGRLAAELERQVAAAGFSFDARPFAPHVTLVRKARCAPLDFKPPRVHWDVREFVLVRSRLDGDGSRYQVVSHWPGAASPLERVD